MPNLAALASSCRRRPPRRAPVDRAARRRDDGDRGACGCAIRHPPPPDWERQKVRNDDSMVIELRYGDVSIVLTGDIGRDVERTLAASVRAGGAPGDEGAASRQRHVE